VHLQDFADVPARWRDDALAERWATIRERRAAATNALETMRRDGRIGSSLQAAVTMGLAEEEASLLTGSEWAEVLIVSHAAVATRDTATVTTGLAPGEKCARCWRVLPEVGSDHTHRLLCLRCADAVESGLVGRPAGA
jgi:isoleucyl-tRNA synthetase